MVAVCVYVRYCVCDLNPGNNSRIIVDYVMIMSVYYRDQSNDILHM